MQLVHIWPVDLLCTPLVKLQIFLDAASPTLQSSLAEKLLANEGLLLVAQPAAPFSLVEVMASGSWNSSPSAPSSMVEEMSSRSGDILLAATPAAHPSLAEEVTSGSRDILLAAPPAAHPSPVEKGTSGSGDSLYATPSATHPSLVEMGTSGSGDSLLAAPPAARPSLAEEVTSGSGDILLAAPPTAPLSLVEEQPASGESFTPSPRFKSLVFSHSDVSEPKGETYSKQFILRYLLPNSYCRPISQTHISESLVGVRNVTGNDEDYLRKIPRVVVQKSALL